MRKKGKMRKTWRRVKKTQKKLRKKSKMIWKVMKKEQRAGAET